MHIACSKYSDLDDLVINKASELNLPLIGGTALEIWASYFGRDDVRKRSDNDLDFITNRASDVKKLQEWVVSNIDSTKVTVDVYYVKSHDISKYICNINSTLVMDIVYILWSKLIRASKKDLIDCKWILSIDEISDEELVTKLEDLGLTESEVNLLNSL